MQQTWDSADYARHGRFVADLAASLVETLQPRAGEAILDVGCGDGFLSQRLAESGAAVVAVDSSPQMVAAALARGVDARCISADAMVFQNEFDAVFSNAALHWMPDQEAVLRNIHRALKPGGRFVAEMGGQGNIASIRVALLAALVPRGIAAERVENNYFFSADEYRALLENAGFRVESIALISRPTVLSSGITGWLETFRRSVLDELPAEQRSAAIEQIAGWLEPVLRDKAGTWRADYVRLRFAAFRP